MGLLNSDLCLPLPTLEVTSGEDEGGIVEVEPKNDSSFVPGLSLHPSLNSALVHSLDPMAHFLSHESKNETSNHCFLLNERVGPFRMLYRPLIQSFLEEVSNVRDVGLIMPSEHTIYSQLTRLLESNYHYIRDLTVDLTLNHLSGIHILVIVVPCQVPGDDSEGGVIGH